MIVERQQNVSRGESVVQRLASDLRKDFPGIQGFAAKNPMYMRQFYLEFLTNQNSNQWLEKLVGQRRIWLVVMALQG
jgi:hypothetical protein